MLINELFSSIDGEARRAGELATFIRTVGCNLRCKYCDSKYTWGHEATNREMSVDEIVEECKKFGNHNITFTGGEPLLQKDADELITRLANEGFDVSIETNGAVDFTKRSWFKPDDEIEYESPLSRIWVCADYKCLTSGMLEEMLGWDKFAHLRSNDVLKFVVGSQEDLELAREVITYIRSHGCNCYVYLSPVFGDIEPAEIVEFMKQHNMQGRIRVQLQLHKFIYPVDMRGV